MLIIELGISPNELAELPQHLVEEMVIYKGIHNVVEYGGNWQP